MAAQLLLHLQLNLFLYLTVTETTIFSDCSKKKNNLSSFWFKMPKVNILFLKLENVLINAYHTETMDLY